MNYMYTWYFHVLICDVGKDFDKDKIKRVYYDLSKRLLIGR